MNAQTKALFTFFFYTIILPVLISGGLAYIFHVNFLITSFTLIALSVLLEQVIQKGFTAKQISDFTEKYSKLPYKKYFTKLTCQNCHAPNIVEIDLDKNTEFLCEQCKRKNAVYTTFTTAIASPHEKL